MNIGLILVILATMGAIIRYMIIPALKDKQLWLFWVKKVVYAIEQLITEEGQGTAKKDFVINFIKNRLKLNISDEDLDVLIEAVVFEMNKIKNKIIA